MKKLFIATIIAVLSVIFRTDVFALDATCTPTEQLRLRNLAATTQITYEYYENKEEEIMGFKVQITGFSADFYIYNEENGTYLKYVDNAIVVSSAFDPGETYVLPFYASDDGICKGYHILSKSITLPTYNYYSEDSLCVGHETYELCKKFTSINIDSQEEFENRVKQYIKSLEKPDEPIVEEEPESPRTIIEIIEDFFIDNYMIFLVSIIVVGTSIIISIEVKKRRSIL